MKTIIKIVTVLFVFSMTEIMAQTPEKMSYQAVIRDVNAALITNQTIGMQISILQGSATGSAVYMETQTPTSNINGLVTIEIGTGNVISGGLNTIDWSNNMYYIKTETDISGGTNYTISGTSQLLSVPYALHAKTAANSFSGNYNDLNNVPTNLSDFNNDTNFTIIPNGNSTNDVLSWNGSAWVATDVCSLFTYYYADKDGDGFGDPFNTVFSCNQPTNYVTNNTDCNDNNANINPTAQEICDGIDNNCDGNVDEGFSPVIQYADNDNDGFGDVNQQITDCVLQSGFVLVGGDCDDNNPYVNPAAQEICDGIDNNCDGNIDIGITPIVQYADLDGDGYGDDATMFSDCFLHLGNVLIGGDCNDADPTINPGAPDVFPPDGIDQNCDGIDGF